MAQSDICQTLYFAVKGKGQNLKLTKSGRVWPNFKNYAEYKLSQELTMLTNGDRPST